MIMPYLGVNNLFDEEFNSNIRINAYGGRYYEPAPGRNGYLGVTLNYNF
jgi:iron complex outermembrane receptor protein